MTDLKAGLLGVDPDLLARRGPVDREVALAMARGAAERLGADHGVATTGVAGPDPQDGHPVGELWVATWTAAGGTATHRRLDPALGRAAIRHAAVAEALQALLASVPATPSGP
jgi:nicotinamide-nucleotide amidase